MGYSSACFVAFFATYAMRSATLAAGNAFALAGSFTGYRETGSTGATGSTDSFTGSIGIDGGVLMNLLLNLTLELLSPLPMLMPIPLLLMGQPGQLIETYEEIVIDSLHHLAEPLT